MNISRQKIDDALQDVWLDTFKDRLKMFFNNEIVEDSKTAGQQLRVGLNQLKRSLSESVTIVDEIFPSDGGDKGLG